MVRAGLASKAHGRGPITGAAYIPAASVVAASALAALPIVSLSGVSTPPLPAREGSPRLKTLRAELRDLPSGP